ncbi:hypothetical protein SNEBB_010290 [Seison nebaliae]|nr:hypothetical protein SNEBB_010290 [Seison nebaliae]
MDGNFVDKIKWPGVGLVSVSVSWPDPGVGVGVEKFLSDTAALVLGHGGKMGPPPYLALDFNYTDTPTKFIEIDAVEGSSVNSKELPAPHTPPLEINLPSSSTTIERIYNNKKKCPNFVWVDWTWTYMIIFHVNRNG